MTAVRNSTPQAQADIDAAWDAFDARIKTDFKKIRMARQAERGALSHIHVARKIEEVEAFLMPHYVSEVTRKVAGKRKGETEVENTGWRLEGWKVEADTNAIALYPITAHLYFRHHKLSGHDAAVAWAETASEECFTWLEKIGFPFADAGVSLD